MLPSTEKLGERLHRFLKLRADYIKISTQVEVFNILAEDFKEPMKIKIFPSSVEKLHIEQQTFYIELYVAGYVLVTHFDTYTDDASIVRTYQRAKKI